MKAFIQKIKKFLEEVKNFIRMNIIDVFIQYLKVSTVKEKYGMDMAFLNIVELSII